MTFKEKYEQETTWQGKMTVMEIYHLAMSANNPRWTITLTARDFNVSIGLVSENLRLAYSSHINPKILECESRQEALKRLNNGKANYVQQG